VFQQDLIAFTYVITDSSFVPASVLDSEDRDEAVPWRIIVGPRKKLRNLR
jgi:hypothetical protein